MERLLEDLNQFLNGENVASGMKGTGKTRKHLVE
jgi:hypothetical protein